MQLRSDYTPVDFVAKDLLSQAPVIINLFSGPVHTIEFLHPLYLNLINTSHSKNVPARDFLAGVEKDAFFQVLDEVFASGKPMTIKGNRYSGQPPNDHQLVYNLFFSAWLDESGAIRGVICNMVDTSSDSVSLRRLEESEKLFRQVAEIMPQLVWIARKDGTVTYYNNRIREFAGAYQDNDGNWKWSGLLHDEDIEPTSRAWNFSVETGHMYEKAHRVKMRDGSFKWHLSRAYAQRDDDGKIIQWFGTATNIHFQKEFEEKLKVSEERLRIAMEAAEMGIWEYTYATGEIVSSPKFKELFGLDTEDAFTFDIFLESIHPLDKERVRQVHLEILNTSQFSNNHYELKYRIFTRNDHQLRWLKSNRKVMVNERNEPVRFIGTIMDITREKLAEEKLRYRKALLEAQNEAIPDGILIVDTRGSIIMHNRRFREIWDMPEEILNKKDDNAALQYALGKIARPDQFIERVNYLYEHGNEASKEEILLSDGRILERHGNAVNGDDGSFYGWAWYFRDVTEAKRVAKEMVRQKELYQNLLEGISDSFISYDFNWNVIYANEKVSAILKQHVEDFVGKNLWEWFPSLVNTEVQEVYQRVMSDRKPEQIEFRSKLSGNWLEVRVYPSFEGISVFSTDISQRRKAEEELNYQKRLLQTVTENTSLALFLLDESQQCIYMNEAAERITGFSFDELKGNRLHTFIHHSRPDGSPYPIEECPIDHALPSRQRRRGEDIFIRKDGRFFPGSYIASPIIINDEPVGTVIEVRDISEEKKAGRALSESEERFRKAFANAAMGMAIIDPEGRYLQINEAFMKISGYSEEELLKGEFRNMAHPDDLANNLSLIYQKLDGDNPNLVLEHCYLHKSGEEVWVRISASLIRDEQGRPKNVIGLTEDITLKKRTQEKLAESEEHFRQLADLVPQMIFTAGADGVTDYFNKRWYEYTCLEPDDQIGSSWISIVHPEDRQACVQAWNHSVSSGTLYQVEYRLRRLLDNSYRWFLGKAVPVKDKDGQIRKWFGTCTDINDQKSMAEKMEWLVRQRTEELQRSNEDLQQFAHIASHDLKEPLRKIITFSSRVSDEFTTELPERAKIFLGKIEHAADRMNRMIEGVLEYSVADINKLPVENISLTQVIHEVGIDLEMIIESKKASIHYPDLPTVRGATILIHQLFYNLINNSLKFSKLGVPPVIEIDHRIASEAEIRELVKTQVLGNYHVFTLRDNGIGFSDEHAGRIFHTFTRLNSKDKYEGTGLGLSLCRKIVKRHNGYIIARGQEGIGAQFLVILPEDQQQGLL